MLPGGVLTVLLVVSITAIASTMSTPTSPKICHERPIKIFIEYFKCDNNYMRNMESHSNLFGEGQTWTKAKLLEYTGQHCTAAKVAAKACFDDVIKDCNSTLKAKLNDLIATGVGFLCQPGERGVEPAITNVINSMNDEDLARAKDSRCSVNNKCFEDISIDWENPSLDGLAQSLQSVMESYVQCNAEKYQEIQLTCPNWRANLLMNGIGPMMSYAMMGVHLTFSEQDMADMFELETNLE